MNRNDKQDWITSLNTALSSSESAVVAKFNALTVAELTELRNKARELGTSIKVTQNRLTKLALKGTNYEELAPLFKGVTLVAWSNDPVSAAKAVYNFAKTNDKVEILGGAMGKEILDVNGVKAVALLPSLDEARAKICAVLTTPAGNLARVFKAYSEKQA
ncbi:MAG: 50S ribosomal protein L10, partial [Alphaproteobacteria bacterium]|nr:50S ribosomal protein L10 [Alphaproteobacteria bacterium]